MKKIIPLLLVICLCLTGCSKKNNPDDPVTCQFDGTSFKIDNVAIDGLTSYNGYYADYDADYLLTVKLEQVDDLAYAEYNYFDISYDDMDLYRKKAYCWSMYGTTQQIMYYPYYTAKDGAQYWLAMSAVNISYAQAQAYMWDIAEKIAMTNAEIYVQCGDEMLFGNDFSYPKVTNDFTSISGTIKISKKQDPECTEPFTVVQDEKNTYTLYKHDTDRYSYYQYGDWLIQTVFGIDLTEYIKFL